MANDTIGNWVQKAKTSGDQAQSGSNVTVVRREVPQNKGNLIVDFAEKIRPLLLKFFEGVRDENGMLLQPAHIRGIALNVAQGILKRQGEIEDI